MDKRIELRNKLEKEQVYWFMILKRILFGNIIIEEEPVLTRSEQLLKETKFLKEYLGEDNKYKIRPNNLIPFLGKYVRRK